MKKMIGCFCLLGLVILLTEAQAQSLEELEKRVKAQQAEEQHDFRDTLRSGGQGPVMVRIPAGRFEQGSPSYEGDRDTDEGPIREVTMGAFSLGKYEVTRGEFRAFVEATGYRTDAEKNTAVPGKDGTVGCYVYKGDAGLGWKAGTSWRNPGFSQDDSHPATCLSWNDANAYTEWLRRETGKPYRLPSESELEYANRADAISAWPWGKNGAGGCRHANHADASAKSRFNIFATSCNDGYVFTAPVGRLYANAFGLHDTAGNVMEWSQDCDHDSYVGAPTNGSAWTSGDCTRRVLRGGSWINSTDRLRVAFRYRVPSTYRYDSSGLRLAKD